MAARQGLIAALVLVTGVSVAGCKSSSAGDAKAAEDSAASITAVDGQDGISRVELADDAARRIGLETGTVRARAAAARSAGKAIPGTLSVPLSAVLYDKDGKTWVYVSINKLAFQRAQVAISGVEDDLAILTSGPAAGTAVVTVGAPELLGAEDGVPGE
jgi:hypothetical protein